MVVEELDNMEEFEDFSAEGLVLIDFFADWCMPCLMMAPVLEDVAEKFKGKIKFAKVNIEDNQDLAKKFNVSSIPNFVLVKEGKVLTQFVGAHSQEDLENKISEFLE